MNVTIRSNVLTTRPVVIHDCGWTVPAGGGSITVGIFDDLQVLAYSRDLLILTHDDAFGPGLPTLYINDGSADIAAADIQAFLQQAPYLDLLPYTFLRRRQDGGLPPGAGPFLAFSAPQRVPASGGLLYLRLGDVACSSAGWVAGRPYTLEAIGVRVDIVDPSRAYRISVVDAPGDGAEATVGFVHLPVNTLEIYGSGLSGVILVGSELGVKVERTSGAGQSSFANITAVVEVR